MAGTHKYNNTLFSSDISSPGYIESVASSKSRTKENLRTEELIPSEILENSGGLQLLLEAYYKFMNLEEFIYQQTETYTDIILDNKAVFRVSDPRNENDHFFTDDDGANSTLTLTDSDGVIVDYSSQLTASNVSITNGNNLPGSLSQSTSEIGKTFTVNFGLPNSSGYVNYNTQTATLITPIKYWAGPGASYALNTIEESMDIDSTASAYLELIQKEIAAVVPRSIQVNKRNLYKVITEYYRIRGTSDSIEVFFRLLFDDEVEVEFPWDETLIPSSGNWYQEKSVNSILASAVNNSSTLVLTVENQEIKLSSTLAVNDVYSIIDNIRVTSVLGSSITVSRPNPILFDARNASVVDISTNQIKLPSTDIVKFPINTKLTYTVPVGGTAIGGLVSGNDYFVISNSPEFIQLSSTEGGSAISLTSMGLLNKHELIRYIKLANSSNIVFHPKGIYLDKRGFLSDTIKIHDSLRYQKFSYLIRTGQNLSSWDYFYNRLVHPAGFEYFAEILIQLFLTRDELGDDQKLLRELRYIGGPKHGQLTGESYFGYGRTNRFTLSSMPDLQPGVIGIEDIPLLVEMFASMFLPFTSVDVHRSGRMSLTVPAGTAAGAGTVTAVEIADAGFGYTTAPTIVVNGVAQTGQTISQATVTCTIDSDGKINSATVTAAGSNYSSAFANVSPNPNLSKIANIIVVPDTTKKYSTPPLISFDAPTSQDSFGVLLSTNVTAAGKYILKPTSVLRIELTSAGSGYTSQPDVVITGGNGSSATAIAYIENGSVSNIDIINPGSGFTEVPTVSIVGNATAVAQLVPSEITSASITNPGFGYVITPQVYIASRAKNEARVKSDKITRILELNHTDIDPEFTKVTNPVQTAGSVRGRQLYNGKLLQKGVLSSGQNWTVTETTPTTDKIMGGYEVTAVSAGYRSIPSNDYYSQKTNILENNMLYDFNETLEILGDVELQSTSISDINKYNVNSFIHTN